MAFQTAVSISEDSEGLRIVMPVPRMMPIAVFMGLWLVGWFFGEVSALKAVLSMRTLLDPAALFMLVWLVGWTASGVLAGLVVVMMLDGCEVLTFTADKLDRRAEAFGRGLNWHFALSDVSNVRLAETQSGAKEFISFDYQGRTIRVGSGLSEREAQRILDAVRDKYPRLIARVDGFPQESAATQPI